MSRIICVQEICLPPAVPKFSKVIAHPMMPLLFASCGKLVLFLWAKPTWMNLVWEAPLSRQLTRYPTLPQAPVFSFCLQLVGR